MTSPGVEGIALKSRTGTRFIWSLLTSDMEVKSLLEEEKTTAPIEQMKIAGSDNSHVLRRGSKA
jgi:hypothetical protein